MDEEAIYDLPPLEKARALLERAHTERSGEFRQMRIADKGAVLVAHLQQGGCHRSPANRLKSRSVEINSLPDSMASAAR